MTLQEAFADVSDVRRGPACQWRSRSLRAVEAVTGEGRSVAETTRGVGAVGPPMVRQEGASEGARRATGDAPSCRAAAIGETCRGCGQGVQAGMTSPLAMR
jgi:hypothetical protein